MELLIRLFWLLLMGALMLAFFFFAWFVALPVILLFVLYTFIWSERDLRRMFSGVMPGQAKAGRATDTPDDGVIIEGDFVEIESQPLERPPASSDSPER